jgi:hypothetical protein
VTKSTGKRPARNPTNFNWSAEATQTLKDMWLTHSRAEIAQFLGTSLQTVSSRGAWLKLPKKGQTTLWTDPDQVALLAELYANNVSVAEITERIGYPYNTWMSKINKLKVKRKPLPPKPKALPKPRAKRALKVTSQNLVFEAAPKSRERNYLTGPAWKPLEGSNPKPLMERKASQCVWPIGESLFCCEPIAGDRSSYCTTHKKLSVVPVKDLTQAA